MIEVNNVAFYCPLFSYYDMNDEHAGDLEKSLEQPYTFPWLLFAICAAVLMAMNFATQPFEDSISLVPPAKAFYLDVVWYLDDIVGPSLFMLAGLILLRRTKFNLSMWPVIGLGLSCIVFALGDTVDAQWVVAKRLETSDQTVSLSSWMSKITVIIVFYFFIIYAYDFFDRKAQKALLFVAILLYIEQIQMSISMDFAGYVFHVIEESLEVITSLFLCLGVACGRILGVEKTNR